MTAFATQGAAAHAAAAQLTASLEALATLNLEAGDPLTSVCMNAVMERGVTLMRRLNELCDTVQAASPFRAMAAADANAATEAL